MATEKIASIPEPALPQPKPRKKRSVFSEGLGGVTASTDAEVLPAEVRQDSPARNATPSGRAGQIAVALGEERKGRLERVWRANAQTFDTRAHLVRTAIDHLLDQLEASADSGTS